MTTEKPEAIRPADALEQGTFLLSVERDATAAELRGLHAKVAELEAQFEAVGAGGVGPLLPRGQVEQPAEQVYQMQKADGSWVDQDKPAFDYNTRNGWPTRIVYTRPQPAQQPNGMVLVPKRMTTAMRRVTDQEGWTWEDLLAAAEAITEDEHAELGQSQQPLTVGERAVERDEMLQVALNFIETLTGMQPPPIEIAPPEVFAPFRDFVDRIQSVADLRSAQFPKRQPAKQKASDHVIAAARALLTWIEWEHRPPVRDKIEAGRMVLVRLHALADLHDAVKALEDA